MFQGGATICNKALGLVVLHFKDRKNDCCNNAMALACQKFAMQNTHKLFSNPNNY